MKTVFCDHSNEKLLRSTCVVIVFVVCFRHFPEVKFRKLQRLGSLPHERYTATSDPGQGTVRVHSGGNDTSLTKRTSHRNRTLEKPQANEDLRWLLNDHRSLRLISRLLRISRRSLLDFLPLWARVRWRLFHFQNVRFSWPRNPQALDYTSSLAC